MMQAPEVEVSKPVEDTVTDYEEFPGELRPVDSVEVRARVTGYLVKMNFKEGAQVQKGDVLFEIDPRPYEADLARAEGNITVSEGHLKRLESDYRRARELLSRGSIGQEEFDRISGDRTEAVGAVQVAKANRDMAKLNLSWTKVTAFQSGRIGRRMIDPGNLVKADETPLTTIVSLEPMYAYFDVDERTTLELQRLIREGKMKWSLDEGLRVSLGLANEKGFSREGRINFADNRVEPDTGTWTLRGRFDNYDHALTPGMFVRIHLPVGEPYKALLVAEEALGTDQGQKFVYVVGKDNKVDYREVKVGRQHGKLRAITGKLSAGEWVVVKGLQRVQKNMPVQPKEVEMPGAPKKASEETRTKGS
jgi:RND family efflux transporter MFP subunit